MLFSVGASCFASSGDFVGMKCGEHVQDSRGGEQASTVVALGMRNIGPGGLEGFGHKVKAASTQVGNVAELGESVFSVTRKNIAAHACAKNDQQRHSGKADKGSPPHFQESVAEDGEKPCCGADA